MYAEQIHLQFKIIKIASQRSSSGLTLKIRKIIMNNDPVLNAPVLGNAVQGEEDPSTLSECIQHVLNLQCELKKAGDRMLAVANRIQAQTTKDMILMDEVRKRYEGNIASFCNEIHLNIGGSKFTTTKDTLLAEPDNFFACMIRRCSYSLVHAKLMPDTYHFQVVDLLLLNGIW